MTSNYAVNVIAHSIAPDSTELLTFSLVYQRFIHAEFMTHRMASRNAASSRAIPVAKMLKQIRSKPGMPIHWGKNQSGMQAAVENEEFVIIPLHLSEAYAKFSGVDYKEQDGKVPYWTSREDAWRFSASLAADMSEAFMEAGYHKQVANRLTEPFQLMQTVATATKWEWMFLLRCHKDAQPEFKVLAEMMREAKNASTPTPLAYGDWHLPYVLLEEREHHPLEELIAMSAARCARVSYLNHEGKNPTLEEDMKLFERLTKAEPAHLSPTEHQAGSMPLSKLEERVAFNGNLSGHWLQYRKVLEDREDYAAKMTVLSTMFESVKGVRVSGIV